MFTQHSIAGRVFSGIMVGLVIGVVTTLVLPMFGFAGFSLFSLGTLIMFFLMGALTGFIGIFSRHPVFEFKMPWWFSGPLVGVVFMTMYTLLAFDTLGTMMQSPLFSAMGLHSPFWAILDGIWIGALMSFVEMKVAGKGENLPAQ